MKLLIVNSQRVKVNVLGKRNNGITRVGLYIGSTVVEVGLPAKWLDNPKLEPLNYRGSTYEHAG